MSIHTESPEISYSALEHTITVDGGWPTCAGCDQPGSHEVCIAEEWAAERQVDEVIRGRVGCRRPGVVFDPEAVRAWLGADDPDEPGERRADRWLTYPGDDEAVNVEDAERLVDEAGRAGLFGPDVRIGLWLDREPADAGPATGWHLTVEITTPAGSGSSGDVLRFAGTWAETAMLHCPTHDPGGVEGLVAVLAAVAGDATDVLDRSLTAVAALCGRDGTRTR